VLLVALALGLVLAVSQLFGGSRGGPDTPSPSPAAAPAAEPSSGLTTSAEPTPRATTDASEPTDRTREKTKKKTPRPVPTGPCADTDVMVTPDVQKPIAGSDVQITLTLNTLESAACNWEVSAESVVVRLTSGEDRVWSSQDCPAAVETEPVAVFKDLDTEVEVTWPGRRSDEECSRTTGWAEPGYYHVAAAALGAEPTDTQFELQAPPRPTITPSPTPGKGERDKKRD
jgi:hypothetical protein